MLSLWDNMLCNPVDFAYVKFHKGNRRIGIRLCCHQETADRGICGERAKLISDQRLKLAASTRRLMCNCVSNCNELVQSRLPPLKCGSERLALPKPAVGSSLDIAHIPFRVVFSVSTPLDSRL